MALLYRTPGGLWRHHVSLAILIVVGVYGLWELWHAYASGGSELDWMFAIGFTAGSAYGFWQILNDTRDRVVTLERDEAAGTLVVVLWRPFRITRLTRDAAAIGDWRVHVKLAGRNAQMFFLYANATGYPRPLQFELMGKIDREGLRQLAPEAIAEFERRAGIAAPAA